MNSSTISLDAMAIAAVAEELNRARSLHPVAMNSAHEAYAVIAEELDEFWEEVRARRSDRNRLNMREELLQTAAMCVRAITDLGLFKQAVTPSDKGQLEAATRARNEPRSPN